MDYYAEELEEAPDVTYIAVVGRLEPDFPDEIISRAQRIREASPEKHTLVLDVRGLTGLEIEDFNRLEELQNQLEQRDWELIFCNIPSRLEDFFQSGRVQRTFKVYTQKTDFMDTLVENPQQSPVVEEESEPQFVPVVFRTATGVRLFEGTVSQLDGLTLTVWTTDHNAKMIRNKSISNVNLYFDTDRIQVVPKQISFVSFDQVDHEHWNYRLDVILEEIDKLEIQQIKEYFASTPASN